MRVQIKPEFQIERINTLEQALTKWSTLAVDQLTKRPSEKSWAPIEVMKHVVIAHNAYVSKIENAIASDSSSLEVKAQFKTSFLPSYLIKRFPPIDGKVKMKMKTTKQFQPVFDLEKLTEEAVYRVLGELKTALEQLKIWVNQYRLNPISTKKFNSALGAIIRFSIPEACEFIVCHNERHFFQIEKALESCGVNRIE